MYLKKSQRTRSAFKAEITVFLSLIFSVLLSLVGAMIESTSISLAKSMNQADLVLAMESVFAEYHPKLLEDYDIFDYIEMFEKITLDDVNKALNELFDEKYYTLATIFPKE